MPAIPLDGRISIRHEGLWDGLSSSLSQPGTLAVQNNLVIAIAETFSPGSDCVKSGLVTILPTLIDCHVHLSLPLSASPSGTAAGRMENYLNAGVVAVRDAGSAAVITPRGPLRVVTTGQAINRAGYYGSSLGTPVTTVSEAEGMVDFLAAQGVHQIKLIASGIFSFSRFGETGPLPFSVTELRIIVERAKRHRLPVMAHASGEEAVIRCLDAGVHSVEHGYFVSRDTLAYMAEQGVFWVPTLSPVAAYLENPELSCTLRPKQLDVVKRSLDSQMEMVGFASRLGVRIGAGTDAGAPGVAHGTSLLSELQLLQQCGLPSVAVLQAATSVAAQICLLDKSMGTIALGSKASLIAVRGNPLEDLSCLKNVEFLATPSYPESPGGK